MTAGRIWVDGDLVGYRERGGKLHEMRDREVVAQRCDIGMVFQRFNLFPHMTVLGNVMEAPWRVRKESRAQARQRAARHCWNGSDSPAKWTRIPTSCPVASSSGSRSRRALAMQPKAHAIRRADQRSGPGAGG